MKRITLVEETLKELFAKNSSGITAESVANQLNLERSNISRDLNQLVREGKVEKKKSRPVLFSPTSNSPVNLLHKKDKTMQKRTQLDSFSIVNPSLFHQIEQAKAALLYPPNGMHLMIFGETGVGKSMFAQLLHHYAMEVEKFSFDSPFIQFNCADYANNPQLLMGQLFGRVKGAYTGAETYQKGLLEQANGGILFLDEVHRLPMEGQEMLFSFIDRGTFKPLGETEKELHSKVLIIAATTESQDHLLNTFIRRIPMILRLPNLKERTIEERFQLITYFLKKEVNKLGLSIKMSVNATKSFLTYDCQNNIGQLESDIKIVCARAYARHLTQRSTGLTITTSDLPETIRTGLLNQIEHRKLWAILSQINTRFFTYEPYENEDYSIDTQADQALNVYNSIDRRLKELEEKNFSLEDIQKKMEEDLQVYSQRVLKSTNNQKDKVNLDSIIPEPTQKLILEVIAHSEKRMGKKLGKKSTQALSIHLFNMIDRLSYGKVNENPKKAYIMETYPELFSIAKESLRIIETRLKVTISEDEAAYLVLFFTFDELNDSHKKQKVQVIVIAHGENTASALCNTVNSLLGNKNTIGLNANLDEKPDSVLERLEQYLFENNIQQDILLLVDMGSLMTFSDEIMKKFAVKAKSIPLVSTLHVLEASRKAMLGCTLDEVYEETLKVNDYMKHTIEKQHIIENTKNKSQELMQKPLALLTICLTGEGTALTIKKILENELYLKKKEIQLIPLNIVGKETIQLRIEEITKTYRVICLVSSFHIETSIPQFDLYSVVSGNGIEKISKTIEEELVYRNMHKTILQYYEIPDLKNVVRKIHLFNEKVESLLNKRFEVSLLLGLSFHIVGMILKDQKGDPIPPFIENNLLSEISVQYKIRIQEWFKEYFQEHFHRLDQVHLDYVAYGYLDK